MICDWQHIILKTSNVDSQKSFNWFEIINLKKIAANDEWQSDDSMQVQKVVPRL